MAYQLLHVDWWRGSKDQLDPISAVLDVERDDDDTNRISIHTFVNDRGSLSTFVLDREEARRLALQLLLASEV